MRLDGNYPSGMKEYLKYYGWHFSKKMCEWAVSRMYRMVGGKKEKIQPTTKEVLDNTLSRFNVSLQNDKGYDSLYVANMCKADFWGNAITEESKWVLFIKHYIDDPDAYEGMPFTRFYADCIGSGTPIPWEDMI